MTQLSRLDTTTLGAAPLAALVAAIARAAGRAAPAARPAAVAEAIAAGIGDPALLAGLDCPCSPDRYMRHRLHDDPAAGYAVVALVWRPGQMSPVHAHRSWCAFGVHRGILTETFYAPPATQEEAPEPSASRLLRPGETCHGAADPRLIHRLANLSCATAVSIHCYGVAFDRMATELNQVLAA
jgi:predicted metal-dependent enzyme (double-stranded beta helix superfamily)